MAEFHRWSTARLAGLLNGRAPAWREWRSDALADVTATIAGTLWAFRAGLDARRRPNLLSMVRAAVIWRANDIAESLHHRHQRRRGRPAALEETASAADAFTVAFAREVCAHLAAGPAPEHALLLIGQGESIAEAARRTGASRQQVYRARERLAARAALSDGAREPPRRAERIVAGAFNGRGELVGRWTRGAAQ